MQGWQILSIITACFVLLVVIDMMRRRKLREKYAGVWLVLASGVVVLAVLPEGATQAVARAAGVQTASNFVFLLSGVVLALVDLHLSVEVGHLEEKVRTSVEEIALLRCELEDTCRALGQRITVLEVAPTAADTVKGWELLPFE
jgi:hypothetical protein